MMVTLFFKETRSSLIFIIWSGSSPFIGSSSKSNLGFPSRVSAIPTLWRYPFESFAIILS